STSLSATTLNMSALMASLFDWGSGLVAPMAFARCSNSMPMPSQSTVFSRRYQAMLSTPTAVMLPPRQPKRSTTRVLTPARAALSDAARPPGPLPTTSTSTSARTGTWRALSVMVFISDLLGGDVTRLEDPSRKNSAGHASAPVVQQNRRGAGDSRGAAQ